MVELALKPDLTAKPLFIPLNYVIRRCLCFHCFISSRCLYLQNSWVRDHSCPPLFPSPLQNATNFWFDQRVMERKEGDRSSLDLALALFNWVIVTMLFLLSRHLFPSCDSKEVEINISKFLIFFYNAQGFLLLFKVCNISIGTHQGFGRERSGGQEWGFLTTWVWISALSLTYCFI